jgi:hypothetical protein
LKTGILEDVFKKFSDNWFFMKGSDGVLEFCYPADKNALELANKLLGRDMKIWYPNNGEKKLIVAGGSNNQHHRLIDVLDETIMENPITLLFLDQHMDRVFTQAYPELFYYLTYKSSLGLNCANFMDEVEEIDGIDQIIYLGVSNILPSTHKLAIDRQYLNRAIKNLFIYVSREFADFPELTNVTSQMLDDPLILSFLYASQEGIEMYKKEHGKSRLYLPSYYPERKRLLEAIEENQAIRSHEKKLDTVDVRWKDVYEFDPTVIRNSDVWISLDFDVFDESAGIPTSQAFGTVPYEWFGRFVDKLGGYDIRGFDYWGFDKERAGYEPLGRIREIHETVKARMLAV